MLLQYVKQRLDCPPDGQGRAMVAAGINWVLLCIVPALRRPDYRQHKM
jgi:hypothetical protein